MHAFRRHAGFWLAPMLIGASLLLSGCGTKKQTYSAPDPAEVREKTRQVKEGIRLSRFDVAEARKQIEAAQKKADSITSVSVSLLTKVDDLARIAPVELQKPIEAIRLDVQELQTNDAALAEILVDAWKKNDAAEKHLAETDAREVELEQKQKDYYDRAWKLADTTTALNARLVDVEKKLSWYRWHWWGSWIALGVGVIASGVVAFLKFTGRLAITASKVAL